jgi:hypothetical protein
MIGLALLLAACEGPGSGGDGSGDDGSGDDGSGDDGGSDGDDGGSGDDAKVSDVSSECTDTGLQVTGGMSASVEADGVHVVDEYTFTCCATFEVEVAVSLEKHWATATYTNVGDKCDCMCRYEVRYTIGGLEKGTWTIESPTGATVDIAI